MSVDCSAQVRQVEPVSPPYLPVDPCANPILATWSAPHELPMWWASIVEDADRCRDKCAASPECNYFTWIKWVQLLFHGLSECNYFTWIKWVQLLYLDQVSATTLPGLSECNYFTWIKWVQLLYINEVSLTIVISRIRLEHEHGYRNCWLFILPSLSDCCYT